MTNIHLAAEVALDGCIILDDGYYMNVLQLQATASPTVLTDHRRRLHDARIVMFSRISPCNLEWANAFGSVRSEFRHAAAYLMRLMMTHRQTATGTIRHGPMGRAESLNRRRSS